MNTLSKSLACLALIGYLSVPANSIAETASCKGSSVLVSADTSLTVEIADDDRSRRYGLRFRDSIGENCGMLFVFDSSDHRTFTMRNTLVPLDIAFIDKDGTIAELTTMQPGSNRYSSMVNATFALEVNAGWFEKNNLSVGSEIKFENGESLQPLAGITDE